MDNKYNILVFPCGSEIGLEIHRSLKFSNHINLFGGSSVDDHGKFVYENYIGDIPFFEDPDFLSVIKSVVTKHKIDAIYPAMDSVIARLKFLESEIGCKVIGSSLETNEVCLSKLATYKILRDHINVPHIYNSFEEVAEYPVFMKPDTGYGSRGAKLIKNREEGIDHLKIFPSSIILDNLPGNEYTIDCFTDKNGVLLFSKARVRQRITNGISVNTIPVNVNQAEFENIAVTINSKIQFSGAWFFQIKKDVNGKLFLLEVASRLGGSSSLFRNIGVNFALLTVFTSFGLDVEILINPINIELDRALNNIYKLDIEYDYVYIDFDDCLLLGDKINTTLIKFIFQCLNDNKKLILITKHIHNIHDTLVKYRLQNIFDQIIHLEKHQHKFEHILNKNSIFIDDSHMERKFIYKQLNIPVFAPDSVECLLKN